jgi:hypothetical protein
MTALIQILASAAGKQPETLCFFDVNVDGSTIIMNDVKTALCRSFSPCFGPTVEGVVCF